MNLRQRDQHKPSYRHRETRDPIPLILINVWVTIHYAITESLMARSMANLFSANGWKESDSDIHAARHGSVSVSQLAVSSPGF
jgi:hypothetical protein